MRRSPLPAKTSRLQGLTWNRGSLHCTLYSLLINGETKPHNDGIKREIDMSGISDREKAFENKFAHDQELRFKAEARRNKLVGLWAAGLLGKADPDAYAKEVVAADFEEAGDEDVIRKVKADLTAGGVSITDEELRAKMVEFLGQAIEQIQKA